ncbi:MAG: hypothetical protein ACI8RZ_002303 [Myxococcota bacterium]|jgi:hypothetical protein
MTLMLLGVGMTAALAAERSDSVERKLIDNDYEGARKKCEKWEASSPEAESPLREVCAKAYWPLVEATDSAAAWRTYTNTWAGTDWAETATERLASATLRELPADASEEDLLWITEEFYDSRAAREAAEMAADAAIRDVSSGGEALRAAKRYPGHAGLSAFVERYPEKFVKATITGHEVTITIEPEIAIPEYMTPTPLWVARWPGGHSQAWREVATQHLLAAGLDESLTRPEGGGPGLPLCNIPGQPEGWHAAVEVRVGTGRMYRPIPWEEGCGPDVLPIVLTVTGSAISGLSLAPGHAIDLLGRGVDGRDHSRAFVSAPGGSPTLSDGRLFLQSGRVWVVYPIDGGPPWLTDRAPTGSAILTTALIGTGPPPGLSLSRVDEQLVLSGTDATEPWVMPSGEVRFLSAMAQKVLGVGPALLAEVKPGAPALSDVVPWAKEASGYLTAAPPSGARSVTLTSLNDAAIEKARLRVASGVDLDNLEIIDGWGLDMDADGAEEIFLRTLVDGRGTLIVLDVHPTLGNRLFLYASPNAGTPSAPQNKPFAFHYGGHFYMAWAGVASSQTSFLELVRYSGESFRSQMLTIPK